MAEMTPWLLMALAVAATLMWRFLGVLVAGRVRPDSWVFEWVTAVAFAIATGLGARIILWPSGALGGTFLADRLVAFGIAVAVFALTRRGVFYGLVAGTVAFGAIVLWRGGA